MGRPIYQSVVIEPGVRLKRTHRGIETEATVWIDGSPLWEDGMRPNQSIRDAQSEADKFAECFASKCIISEVVPGKREFMDGVESWFDLFIGSAPGIMLYDLPPINRTPIERPLAPWLPPMSMRPQPSSVRPPQARNDVVQSRSHLTPGLLAPASADYLRTRWPRTPPTVSSGA